MRAMSIWSLCWVLGLGLIAQAVADEVEPPDFPTTVNIGVVFPRNDSTYNSDLHLLPVVFAIQNARALFWFGWTIRWDIKLITEPGETSGPSSWGQLSYTRTKSPLPPDAVGDDWVVGNSSWSEGAYEWKPGPYRFNWSLSHGYCTTEPNRLIIQPAIPLLEGAVDFDVVDDGTGEPFNITSGCPVYQSSRLIRGASSNNRGTCMFISDEQPDEAPDLCHLELDQTMADCIMSNITRSDDRSACEAWARRGRSEDGGEDEGGDETDEEDGHEGDNAGNSGSGSESNRVEEDGASALSALSAMVITIVLLGVGFVWTV